MNFVFVIVLALLFPLIHVFTGWAFKFAEVLPYINLIYLPAFARLVNVLVLGPLNGTLATVVGNMLLMAYLGETASVAWLHSACSAGGPLIALSLFKVHTRRGVNLTSLRDLTWLTLMYAVSNALLYHMMWSVLDPSKLVEHVQVLWMIVGDILGALLGAYLMKWSIVSYRLCRQRTDLLD